MQFLTTALFFNDREYRSKETVTAFSCLTHTCNIRGHNNFVASSLLCSCLANVYVIGHFWSNMALFRVICSILCSLFIVSGIIDNGNCFLVCNSFRLCTITRLSFLTVSSCSKGFPVNSYPIPTRTKSTRTQYQLVPKLTRTHYQLVPIQLVPKSTRTQFVLILSVRFLCPKNKPRRMQSHRVIMYYLISVGIWLQLM